MNSTQSSTGGGEQVAARYIQEQIKHTRTRLRHTRVMTIVFAVAVLGYLGIITHMLKKEYLDPKPAAAMVNLQLSSMINANAPALTAELKLQIPALISSIPDRIIEQLPALRTSLEDQLEELLRRYCLDTGAQLGSHLDDFLKDNEESIEALVEAGQHPAAVATLGDHFEAELTDYLKTKDTDGKSIQTEMGDVLTELNQIEARLNRLANATDLNPEELKLRRAIAVTLKSTQQASRDCNAVVVGF